MELTSLDDLTFDIIATAIAPDSLVYMYTLQEKGEVTEIRLPNVLSPKYEITIYDKGNKWWGCVRKKYRTKGDKFFDVVYSCTKLKSDYQNPLYVLEKCLEELRDILEEK